MLPPSGSRLKLFETQNQLIKAVVEPNQAFSPVLLFSVILCYVFFLDNDVFRLGCFQFHVALGGLR